MTRPKIVVGLRDSSPEDIERVTKELERQGFTIEHKTHNPETGVKLPHNGVLLGTKKVKSN